MLQVVAPWATAGFVEYRYPRGAKEVEASRPGARRRRLVHGSKRLGVVSEAASRVDETLAFLGKRRGLLAGVCDRRDVGGVQQRVVQHPQALEILRAVRRDQPLLEVVQRPAVDREVAPRPEVVIVPGRHRPSAIRLPPEEVVVDVVVPCTHPVDERQVGERGVDVPAPAELRPQLGDAGGWRSAVTFAARGPERLDHFAQGRVAPPLMVLEAVGPHVSIQRAPVRFSRREGLSVRGTERSLGGHEHTVRLVQFSGLHGLKFRLLGRAFRAAAVEQDAVRGLRLQAFQPGLVVEVDIHRAR